MDLGWILLGLVGWSLAMLALLLVMRMSGDQDRAARREQAHLYPHSDETITQSGVA